MARSDDNEMLFKPNERFILDVGSPVPLYHQMEQILQQRVMREDAVGCMLPPEKDLMQIFGVSRATIKKTLDNLVSQGLIERRRAVGTRVIRHEITEELARLSSYTEEMQRTGHAVRSEVLDVSVHQPDDDIRGHLKLAPGEETLCITRLRGTNDVFPVVLLCSEIPVSFGVAPGEDFSGSLYKIIEERHGIPIVWAEETISAREADAREAKLLHLKKNRGVLVMERTTVTLNDRPLEFVRGVYRPEHYRFSIRLRRAK